MACLEVSCETIWYNGDWGQRLSLKLVSQILVVLRNGLSLSMIQRKRCFMCLIKFEKWLVLKYDLGPFGVTLTALTMRLSLRGGRVDKPH